MKPVWAIILLTVLVAVGVVAYVVFGVVLSTTELRSGESEFEANEDGSNDHIVRFFDDDGDEIAKVFVRADQRSENGYSLLCRSSAIMGHVRGVENPRV